MKKLNIETGVGVFLIIGIICLAYLSIKLGDVEIFNRKQYLVKARFANISGLKERAIVEIAGVTVGKVAKISLDDYEAVVELSVDSGVKLQEDSIVSIRTQGIVGDKYVKISPGGMDEYIEPGGVITDTESTVELEELISKYIFEKE